ncbi:MAG: addiction module protein [Gammaproteobacteria bacterium]|nr:addiction module protein [Gammaproteobacteria bacterium]
MAISVEKLTEAVLSLPSEARALLADRLVESLDPLADEDVRDLWAAEALRRRDEVREGKIPAISGEAALEQVRNSLKK